MDQTRKVIRETSLTTKGGMACVDFAKTMNLHYIEFDAGWYGHEYDDASDARTLRSTPNAPKGRWTCPRSSVTPRRTASVSSSTSIVANWSAVWTTCCRSIPRGASSA